MKVIACIVVVMVATIVKHTWPHSKYRKFLHESAALLLFGFFSGLFLWAVRPYTARTSGPHKAGSRGCRQVEVDFGFSQSLFWDYVLPPIIFHAGWEPNTTTPQHPPHNTPHDSPPLYDTRNVVDSLQYGPSLLCALPLDRGWAGTR